MNLLTLCVCRLDRQLHATLTAELGFLLQNIMVTMCALHLQTLVTSAKKETILTGLYPEVPPCGRFLSLSILPVLFLSFGL